MEWSGADRPVLPPPTNPQTPGPPLTEHTPPTHRPTDRQWYTSRLGPGSGSTPSVTRCQGRDMVVLTDGELGMALVYLDAETGERRKKRGSMMTGCMYVWLVMG